MEPAAGLRELVFMSNLAAQETTGDTASSMSVERVAHRLRGSAVYDSVALALVEAPVTPLQVVNDLEEEWEVSGYLLLGLPLTEDRDVLDVEVILDASHQPLPGEELSPEATSVLEELLAEATRFAARHHRCVLQTWLLHSPAEEPGSGPFTEVLRADGYSLGLAEAQGYVEVTPEVVESELRFTEVTDLDFPAALVDDVITLRQLAAADIPHGSLQATDIEWTPQRLLDARSRLIDTQRRSLVVVAHDGEGVVGLTEVLHHAGSEDSVLEQDLTVVVPRARGRGVAADLKRTLLNAIPNTFPAARRVYTSCAVDNAAMIAVNELLRWTIISGSSGWERRL
ncbi:N-acetyltransferase [Corynebacterium testudinoris]|uniref:N-acetyltransferase domain-containing protein n=2 Tax=Corynebacterium testudinoris TaxID=136857 RepID=A0A0G3H6G7_9CORY|nr:hypothetical protein CTEST_07830 [Corynebacterium testudinoris]MBX8995401.1 N-acetyltransferase [Corynebacterium testudinoris]